MTAGRKKATRPALASGEPKRLDQDQKDVFQARRLFAAFIENSSDFIGIADADGRPVYLNPGGRRMVGLAPDFPIETIEMPEYYPADLRAFASEVILKSMLEEGHWQGETYFRHWQTGEAIPVSDKHFLIRDPATDELVGMGTITRDISDLVRVTDALRVSEAKFSGVVSIATDAIISVNEAQQITTYNDAAQQIFGWAPEEVIGKPLDLLIPERFREIHRQHIRNFAGRRAQGRRLGTRRGVFGLRKNGEEFPADAGISKLHINGEWLFTVLMRDVTERLRVEREQRFLTEFSAVLTSSLDSSELIRRVAELAVRDFTDCCVVDLVEEKGSARRLVVVHADPAEAEVCRTLERTRPDRPRYVERVIAAGEPLLMTEISDAFLESVAESPEHLGALRALGPNSGVVVPLAAQGRTFGTLTFATTGPARRHDARDLIFAEELARRAALGLGNARLYEMAQRALQARDDVLGVVAHDLRNPIGTITMQAALLRRRGGGPERRARKPVDVIERAVRRLNRLVQDLIDVSRMEAGRLAIEQARVPALQVMNDLLDSQRQLASSASLELRLEAPKELPEVWADRDRLVQVFENLIGNAVKFTPASGCVTVGAAPRDGELLFWVKDTGRGIPAEALPHIFERFWQARQGERRGSGLGLPIVKGIVEAHAGRVWAESVPDQGSTFFFTIPLPPLELRHEPAA